MQALPSRNGAAGGERAHLRELRNFVLRNRWLTLGIPLLVLAATAAFVALATPVYEASTTIRIDEQRSNVPLLDALQTISQGSKIETEMQVLGSRTLAEDVVDSLGLQLALTRPKRIARDQMLASVSVLRTAPEATYELTRQRDGRFLVRSGDGKALGAVRPGEVLRLPGVVALLTTAAAAQPSLRLQVTPFERTVKDLRKALSIDRPDRDADILEISYRSEDRHLTQAVPDMLAARFMGRREQTRSTAARSTVGFLSQQIDALAGQLATAENDLRAFREADRVIAPEAEAKADITHLAELQAQRDLVDAERGALGRFLAQVGTPGQGADTRSDVLIAFPTLLKNQAAAELLQSLSQAQDKRNELLARRKPEDPDVQILSARIGELEQQLKAITSTYLDGLTTQVASLDAVLSRSGEELRLIPARDLRYARLERQAKLLGDLYSMLQTRLKEAQIAAAVEDASVLIVDPAMAPMKPVWPKRGLSLILALVVGLALGTGAAVAREQLDTTVHTRDDLQLLTGGLPVLGTIPRIALASANGNGNGNGNGKGNGRKRRRQETFASRLVVGREPLGAVAEAYRSLRTNITFSRPEAAPRTLVVTSAAPGDGKSTTSVNFAAMLAQQELRCLLVDADLRRGVLHKVLGVPQEPGLSDVLLGRATPEAAIHRLDSVPGGRLHLLGRGFAPPNPAELLGSPRMQALLEQLAGEYDMIILDAPPLNLVTDAALLGRSADGVVLVARAGVSERAALSYAVEQLAAVRAPVLGVVLNDVKPRKDSYYGSYAPPAHYYAGGD